MTQYYKQGDNGQAIKALQTHLNTQGYPVAIDGDFGPATHAAVKQLQQDKGLIADGIVGPKTYEALQGRDIGKFLSDADIADAAEILGVDIPSIHAIKAVESRGTGYLPDGRLVILYERHVMKKRLKTNGTKAADITTLQSKFPELVNSKTGGYKGGATEHYRLNLACDIDHTSAHESCSWGLFQIMGYHWERLGFSNVHDFVRAQQQSEGNQLAAFCTFIHTDAKLHQALQEKDWAKFARIYNGPGYKKNNYDTKLAAAYENAGGIV